MSKTVYVVYWVDLDDDCLKKSEIKILGVFDNEKDAKELEKDYEHEGYCEDSRCYYTNIEKLEINVIPQNILQDLCEFDNDYTKCHLCEKVIKQDCNYSTPVNHLVDNYFCKDCFGL